jgi:hypothetical protein
MHEDAAGLSTAGFLPLLHKTGVELHGRCHNMKLSLTTQADNSMAWH